MGVPQTPKKRAKLYCSEKCRIEFFRKKKPKGKPGRPKKENVEIGVPKFTINDFEKGLVLGGYILPSTEQEITEIEAITALEAHQNGLKEKIAAIKAEKIPKERDTPNGRKSWNFDQKKRIEELQSKLK
jgi:hypothetical protein